VRTLRVFATSVLAGIAAGALAGLLVGGVGGRLAMLLLRLTSPEAVLGLTSDDGFRIGVVSAKTLGFVLQMTVAGAPLGAIYGALRLGIPPRLRLPLWTLACAAYFGQAIVHEEGIDFTLLEPVALAVALFVALPAAWAALVAALVERWLRRERPPRVHRVATRVVPLVLAGVAAFAAVGLADTVSRLS
jgi:hypothetical protein